LDRYKEILASKFTPSAISYLLRHSLSEMELAMGVVCMEMVDPIASGVVYTKDPTNPSGDYLLVNAIFGPGSYLVEGIITPDVFHVSRDERKVILSRTARKPVQLTMRPEGGVEEKEIPEEDQNRPSLQDIEWALDTSGKLFLLQARSLRLLQPIAKIQVPEDFRSSVLLEGGTPVCFGVGIGPIYHITSIEDLEAVPSDAVLVAPNPSPKLITVLDRISALVTLVGGTASHLATLVRELSIPTIAGLPSAINIPQGQVVTVDASGGVIYDGSHPEWIPPKEEKTDTLGSRVAAAVIDSIIAQTTRLSLINPEEPGFFIENCSSMHDLLRYIHQKSMEEMFSALTKTTHKDHIGLRLKTKIPLLINIILLDQDYMGGGGKRWIPEDAIESLPMRALWEGVLKEGWPSRPVPPDMKGFFAVVGTDLKGWRKPEFSENSYAFLSEEYMLLNLRMGYHFSTFEALVTPEPEKNYIRMQFKLGGAPLERRIRRIWLICELLRKVGLSAGAHHNSYQTT
ncbi:MAG: hypothetical protein JRC86_13745, partial [Deltaproteobacteria bacterium]|nr:hypothetical protein [Deltaproteobacteria bacterium]